MRNYNPSALAGDDYDDQEFQRHMSGTYGINIPDALLYTPKLNDYVQDELMKYTERELPRHLNHATGKNWTPEEAKKEARMRAENGRANTKLLGGRE